MDGVARDSDPYSSSASTHGLGLDQGERGGIPGAQRVVLIAQSSEREASGVLRQDFGSIASGELLDEDRRELMLGRLETRGECDLPPSEALTALVFDESLDGEALRSQDELDLNRRIESCGELTAEARQDC